MKVEIGSGGNPKEGYIHCNTTSFAEHTEHVCRADSLPFNENSVDEIFMTGVFEHLSLEESGRCLKEWFRCLKNGGLLDLNTPDFTWFIKCLLDNKIDPPVASMNDMPWEEQREWLLHGIYGWQRNPDDFHRWGWTEETLRKKIEDAGFIRIELYSNEAYEGRHLCFRGYKP